MKKAVVIIVALVLFAAAGSALAADPVNTNWRSIAMDGYDPVAYFIVGQPVEGDGDFEIEWQGARWRFANTENLAAFQADPEKYAPQYGGYCAWAVAQGYLADGDPDYWKIVDGKLYLNYNREVQEKWEKDIPGFIQSADQNWPGVLD